jgi:hypothetical protein
MFLLRRPLDFSPSFAILRWYQQQLAATVKFYHWEGQVAVVVDYLRSNFVTNKNRSSACHSNF